MTLQDYIASKKAPKRIKADIAEFENSIALLKAKVREITDLSHK